MYEPGLLRTGQGKISMVKYLHIQGVPEVIKGGAATSAANHLFQVQGDGEAKLLPEEQALSFHYMVAQLLFLSSRAHRDVQLSMAFLTTRVRAPDEDDCGKLRRCLNYLRARCTSN